MAFAIKYQTTLTNINSEVISVQISEDGFTGTVEEFGVDAGNAIRIIHEAPPDDKFAYILPSRAEIIFYTNHIWDMNEFLYANDRQFKMTIIVGSQIEFEGWVIAGVQSENHSLGTYSILITATDGLADLKIIPYLSNGELYDVYQTPAEIIYNCLSKIQLTSSYVLRENTDIFATTGMTRLPTTDYTPLNQCSIHSRSYGSSISEILSCWDVLEKIMQAFYCRLFQSKDVDPTRGGITWIMSKIDRLYLSTTYRWINNFHNVVGGGSYYFVPVKSIGIHLEKIGNGGQITAKQGFKEVKLVTKRNHDFSLLTGTNFDEDDFATDTSLKDWGNNALVGGYWWGTASLSKEQLGNDTVVALDNSATQGGSTLAGDPSVNNGSGKLRILSSNIPSAGTIILIENKDYRVFAKVVSADGAGFNLDVSYVKDQDVRWVKAGGLEFIGYLYPLSLDEDHIPVTDSHYLKVSLKYFIEDHLSGDSWGFAAAIVIAYKSPSDYKVLNKEGKWATYNSNIFPAIIDTWDEVYLNREPFEKKATITITADLSTGNNFYSSGNPKFYIGLFNVAGDIAEKRIKWQSVHASLLYGKEKKTTIVIDDNFVQRKDITFFHADGDAESNEEFRYLHPISNTASPKTFINSWKQRNESSKNLEDIIQENIINSSSINSQIWAGTLHGDLAVFNIIQDSFNFNRIFQIQSSIRNLMNKNNEVNAIECIPKVSYYVEIISKINSTQAEYYLSSVYGNITSLFNDGDTVYNSSFHRKTDGLLISEKGSRDLDGPSFFTGGRTVFVVDDVPSIPGTVEVKGILTIEQ